VAERNPFLEQALAQIQASAEEAKQANLERYNSILATLNPLTQQTQATLSGVPGQYQKIADFYGARTGELRGLADQFGASYRQQLADREAKILDRIKSQRGGMAGSYISSLYGTAHGASERARLGLEDALTRMRMETIGKATGEEAQARAMVPQATTASALQGFQVGQYPLGVMERRTDVGPSMQDAALLGQYGGTGLAAAQAPTSMFTQGLSRTQAHI